MNVFYIYDLQCDGVTVGLVVKLGQLRYHPTARVHRKQPTVLGLRPLTQPVRDLAVDAGVWIARPRQRTTRQDGRYLQLRFDFDSTAVRLRYDHSTTYVTTGLPGLDWPLCHCAVAQAPPPLQRTQAPLAPSKFFDVGNITRK